ncbi:bifunctional diguanylate cyclase/phosphodiesterase [Azoarcus sp. KH32C]|uniref:putative bifunctional diguanylate cyclase/phosphodiesterase n=1 Tax=Azoarcus sp. KH32C TaxID=748247 RepID=UPI000347C8EE|nr:EAL domain-containing protein [Azoarcus sp. KH32C]
MNEPDRPDEAAELRGRAESLLREQQRDAPVNCDAAGMNRLVHELQVHQIELELQNAELTHARDEIEDGLRRYTELYDFAPVAYLTLDYDFVIRQINLTGATLLGIERSLLIGRPFKQFVAPDGRSDFADFVVRILGSQGRETCEIPLLRPGGAETRPYVHIEAVAIEPEGSLRVMVFDITEQKRLKEMIWRQANYDPLTQLPNRRLFIDRLRHDLETTHRAGQMLALLFIDLDRFKEVNDTYGHDAGDKLLIEAARRMSECVRATDTVARFSGDEFTIALSALTEMDRIGSVAGDIVEALAQPFVIGDAVLHVSASIGITMYPLDANDMTGLIRNADQAMYVAKAAGRNRFSYFTPSLQRAAQERLDLIRDLRVALPGGQFEVHFQPIVDLATGRVVKAEALLRWHHPQRGMVCPGAFIGVTEDVGLSGILGDWVFAEAAHWARRWRDEPGHAIQVSVNVSPMQFAIAGSAERWGRMLADLALAGSQIGIDVTEGLLLNDSPVAADELRRVREAGITVAVDGFGTGQSALACLTKSEIDVIKIDRSLVRDLGTDANDRALIDGIIAMAHKLGIQVVAEGVETPEQRDMLRAAGCDFGQGFLFAPPLPPESVWARWATLPM